MVTEERGHQAEDLAERARRAFQRGDIDLADELVELILQDEPSNLAALTLKERMATELNAIPDIELEFAAGVLVFGDERYQVTGRIGEGSSRRVYLAHDRSLNRSVALAVVGADQPSWMHSRLLREARIGMRIGAHQHLVPVHDAGSERGVTFAAFELMTGGDLRELLGEHPNGLPMGDLLRIAGEVAIGLDFLHSFGVVHRNVKPTSVWLDSRGSAKLGNLGLALSPADEDLQESGLIGTPAYMPPEQALGERAQPQSDLYSLGAVIYELITGRPPFTGDEAATVIAQHISAEPMAPGWLREDCPADLERLTLDLVAKRGDQRPMSASVVLRRLGSINISQPPARRVVSGSAALGRLAGGAFVGRERELAGLQESLDAAIAGNGSVSLVEGEPGMGKSRLVQQLAMRARTQGVLVLTGHTREGVGARPYLPWIEIGNQYARLRDVDEIAERLPSEVTEALSRLFPGLAPDHSSGPATDPEHARLRMFDAFSAFMTAAADTQPVLLVLEDLHWADAGTIQLLEYFAFEALRGRILVLGTLREGELDRRHPLRRALGSFGRSQSHKRIAIEGLNDEDIGEYIKVTAGIDPQPALVREIASTTDGNAFFVTELVALLAQSNALSEAGFASAAVPDRVADVLNERVGRMSENAIECLATASLIGRSFGLEALARASERSKAEVVAALDEAAAFRVIEAGTGPGQFRFRHALMQEQLRSFVPPAQRMVIHGRIGMAIEQLWAERARERPSPLADHFTEAAPLDPGYAQRGAMYCRLAAEEAERSFAWSDATRRYKQCLELGAVSAPLARDASLQLSLGRCAKYAMELRTAYIALMSAISLHREEGLAESTAEAALLTFSIHSPREVRMHPIDQALEELGEHGDDELTGRLLVQRLRIAGLDGDQDDKHQKRLDEILARHSSPTLNALVTALAVDRAVHQSRLEDAIRLGNSALEQFFDLDDTEGIAAALYSRAVAAGQLGRLEQARDFLTQQEEFARKRNLRQELGQALQGIAALHIARGEFDQARATIADMPDESFAKRGYQATLAEQAGELEQAADLLPPAAMAAGVPGHELMISALRARVLFNAGRAREARDELNAWQAALPTAAGTIPNGLTPIGGSVGLIDEALPVLGDDGLVWQAYMLVTEVIPDAQHRRTIEFRGLDYARGALALRLGLPEEAEAHFRTGYEWARSEGCPVWEGRCLMGFAEVAHLRNRASIARDYLNDALRLFALHEAGLYLRQGLAKKLSWLGVADRAETSIDLLLSSRSHRPIERNPPALGPLTEFVTFMFTDIVSSVTLTEQLGDAGWMELLRHHNATLRRLIHDHEGHVVKTVGDAFMAVFARADDGIRCAIAIEKAFPGGGGSVSPVRVRIGLHSGEAVHEEGDYYGHHVNIAARVGALAGAGQILVSASLRELVSSRAEFGLRERPPVRLKGIEGRFTLYEIELREGRQRPEVPPG